MVPKRFTRAIREHPRALPIAAMSLHLWLDALDAETVSVFATAFTLSARKRSNRVSTERFLAALPDRHKEWMARVIADADSDCKMSVAADDLPAPELPADWQEKICFSTCLESTLLKCRPETSLVAFLKHLCATAVRLHCVVDRNMKLDSYLPEGDAIYGFTSRLCAPSPSSPNALDRRQLHPATALAFDDVLAGDVLHTVMLQAQSVEALRKCKAVCTSWRKAVRHVLCDVDWLHANKIGLHDVLKKGSPSPSLVVALAAKQPTCVLSRDGEGLLPLQYAAAYRMNDGVVNALRMVTAGQMPGSAAWASSAEARSIKSHLRPVRTRVAHGPILHR